MRQNLFLILISMFTLASCSKSNSGTPPAKTDSTTVPVSNKLLVKSISYVPNTNIISQIDTITYDASNRIIKYESNVLGNLGFKYDYLFNYTGSNTYPDSYLFTKYQNDVNGNPNSGQSVTCLTVYNADKKLLLDSTLLSTNTSPNAINHSFSYTQNIGLVVKKSVYPGNPGQNNVELDSIWYDGNGNYIAQTRGSLDTNNHFILKFKSTETYGTIHNPFYTENASIILFIINGGIISKFLQTSTKEIGYNLQGDISYTQNLTNSYTTDSNGNVQAIAATLDNNPFLYIKFFYR